MAIVRRQGVEVRGLARLGLPLLERQAGVGNNPTPESPADWRWMKFSGALRVWELGHALLRRGLRVAEPLVLAKPARGETGWVAFSGQSVATVGRAGAADVERFLHELRRRGFACPSEWRSEYGERQNGRLTLSPHGLAWLAQSLVAELPPRTSQARAA
jgi:hypothetical protein